MSRVSPHIVLDHEIKLSELTKGIWIVLLHTDRIPPHAGMLFNGSYFSHNIYKNDYNVSIQALLKRVNLLGIKAVFVKLKNHPVYSVDYIKELFEFTISLYPQIVNGKTTCYTPIRSLFKEVYFLPEERIPFLYTLFPMLYMNEMVKEAFSMNMPFEAEHMSYFLPIYSEKEISNHLSNLT